MSRGHGTPQVTDTTTFTAEERRAEVDAWLYETCTQCLQHMVDIVALFYTPVAPILPRIFDLLTNFVRCAAAREAACDGRLHCSCATTPRLACPAVCCRQTTEGGCSPACASPQGRRASVRCRRA